MQLIFNLFEFSAQANPRYPALVRNYKNNYKSTFNKCMILKKL